MMHRFVSDFFRNTIVLLIFLNAVACSHARPTPAAPAANARDANASAAAANITKAGAASTQGAQFQEPNFTGYSGLLAPTPEEYQALEETKMIRSFAPSDAEEFRDLPASVDLSKGLPQARNQGKQHSCTAWATAFVVKSFQENREFGWGLDEAHLFSPSFVYNQVNGGKDDGAKLLDVLQFVTDYGTVPYTAMPYDEKDFTSQPDPKLRAVAARFRGLGYRRVSANDYRHLQAHLAAGDPVIIVIAMYSDFLRHGMEQTQNIFRTTTGDALGNHAVVAVGYDNAKHALKVINSWGPEWGDNGYGWIDYDVAPHIIKQAFVLYDRPTPPAMTGESNTMPSIASGDSKTNRAPASGVASTATAVNATDSNLTAGASEEDLRVLIVPDEAGITLGGHWLRLTEPLGNADQFFSVKTSPEFREYHPSADGIATHGVRVERDALGEGTIRKLYFPKTATFPISTNLGATFGTAQAGIYRMYGKPDYVDPSSGEETYFFHAVAQNWGGLRVVQHASLNFVYDTDKRVAAMTLESVFKKVKMNQGFQKFDAGEQEKSGAGTTVVVPQHPLTFVVPPQFSDVKKSVWEGTGVGYFCNNPQESSEYFALKIFDFPEAVNDAALKIRMDADLKAHEQSSAGAKAVEIGGVRWLVVDLGTSRFYYAAKGQHIVQVQMGSSQNLSGLPWVKALLDSIKITE